MSKLKIAQNLFMPQELGNLELLAVCKTISLDGF